MRHEFVIPGYRFRLRPVEYTDADFIVELRGSPSRGEFLRKGAVTGEQQRRWLDAYFAREGDYYFVVESVATRSAEGVIGLYDVDAGTRTGEMGRWILREGSWAAVESALLVYRFAFSHLMLDDVFCRTLKANARVVSFHDSCGMLRMGSPVELDVDGARMEAVEHRLSRAAWPGISARLQRLAERSAQTCAMESTT